MTIFRKKLVAIAAPSGGGKTTLCKMLCARYKDLELSISYTTRAPRGTEKNGIEYVFVSQQEFERKIKESRLVEWAHVHGNYYGTSRDFLDEKIRLDRVVILDIDVQGVESLKKIYGNDCLSIFLVPPSMEELEKRLRARQTESEEKIQARLTHARSEMKAAEHFDHQILNDQLELSFKELCKIVEMDVGLVG